MPLFKKTSGNYEAKRPVMGNPEDGVSVKEMLLKASGKTAGQDLTMDDIQAIVSRSNMSGKDAKRTMKGASRFLNSGYDYRSKEGSTYDVFDQGTPMSQTSRNAGDRRGKDFMGDVLKSGRNVGLVVGLAKSTQPKTNTSSSGSTGFNPDFKEPTLDLPEMNPSTLLKGASQWRKGSSGGGTTANTSTGKGGGGDKKTTQSTGTLPEWLKPNEEKGISTTYPGNLFNGGGGYDVKGADAEFKRVATVRSEREQQESYDPQLHKRLLSEYTRRKNAGDPVTAKQMADDYRRMGNELFANTAFTFATMGALAEWQAAKNIAKPVLKNMDIPKASRWMKDFYSQTANKVKFNMKDIITKPKIKKGSVDAVKKAVQGMDDEMAAAPWMRKGGKLMGGNGVKMIPAPENKGLPVSMDMISPEGSTIWSPGRDKLLAASKVNTQIKPFNPENAKISIPSYTGGTGSPTGNYQAKFPGEVDPFANGNKALDYIGTAGKYILPFIGEGLARKAWKDVKPMKWSDANYKTGAVRDLPVPNLNLRARNPVGPDVQSELTGQKFADAQQRDAQANYQIQNAMSKLEQENQVLARTNEGIARNKQGRLQTDMVNAQLNTTKAGAMADTYREPFIAAQQHLNQDMSSSAYLDFAKKSALAEQILKYGDKGPHYNSALKWINAKKGGKLKAC
jgi:hypothetical protein